MAFVTDPDDLDRFQVLFDPVNQDLSIRGLGTERVSKHTNGEILDDNTFKASGHRVRNTNWSRYSVVMFFAVNDDELIAPLPRFVSESNPPRHSAITQREHIDSEVSRAVSNRDN